MTSPVRVPRPTPRSNPDVELAPSPRRLTHLEVVRVPSRRQRTGAVVALAIAVVFASLLAAALLHSQVVSGQAHLDDIDRQIELERDGLARDRLALADSRSPVRIAEAAALRGMVKAPRQHWLSPVAGTTAVVTGEPPVTVASPGPAPVPGSEPAPGLVADTAPATTPAPATDTAPATAPASGGTTVATADPATSDDATAASGGATLTPGSTPTSEVTATPGAGSLAGQ